jgi:G:T-mismatch repair DNA endonuclease (very short patch repair protein)
MADVFSKKKRSQVMAAIRSKGNKDTELKLASIFRAHGIKGWRRHQSLPGKPDFVFLKKTCRGICGWLLLARLPVALPDAPGQPAILAEYMN